MPERWLPVVGYEDSYEVSDRGQVRSVNRYRQNRHGPVLRPGRIITPNWVGPKRRRYAQVRLYGTDAPGRQRGHLVHLLVLTAFVGPQPEGQQGLHRDDDQTNNALSNLYWGTPRQNWDDRRRSGGWHPCRDCATRIAPTRDYCRKCLRRRQREAAYAQRQVAEPFYLSDTGGTLPTLARETLAAALATSRSMDWRGKSWEIRNSEGRILRKSEAAQ